MVNKQHRNTVKKYRTISDRIIVVSFEAKPVNINIVQIYAPTSEADDRSAKPGNNRETIIMGDFNEKIRETTDNDDLSTVVDRYYLGERNERRERLLHFCTDNNLFITNTERYRNQIDYLLIKSRWRTMIKDVKIYPGKDCNSDHQFLAAELRMKLWLVRRQRYKQSKWHLKHNTVFQNTAKQELEKLKEHQEDLVNDLGLSNQSEIDKYRGLNVDIKRSCREDKNQYLNEMCQKIEHKYKNETRDMFKKSSSYLVLLCKNILI
ncbi:hypothetical protein ACFW04_014774 [Cataglyphis niger]